MTVVNHLEIWKSCMFFFHWDIAIPSLTFPGILHQDTRDLIAEFNFLSKTNFWKLLLVRQLNFRTIILSDNFLSENVGNWCSREMINRKLWHMLNHSNIIVSKDSQSFENNLVLQTTAFLNCSGITLCLMDPWMFKWRKDSQNKNRFLGTLKLILLRNGTVRSLKKLLWPLAENYGGNFAKCSF